MRKLILKESVQKIIKSSMNDPIVNILLKNSHLTKTQLETLLIDVLAENFAENQLSFEEKAKLRLIKPSVTRGAFNRTLKQAKNNIVKSIYTIMLLGYLGIFENSSLTPYIEISNKLKTYIETYKKFLKDRKKEEKELIVILREEIEKMLTESTRDM
ncbi:MAG TPA: hypothetical protein ENG10_04620 [Candidatus Bathyarchaeota archaeon]|nr:hypothetical protein [Candidatus Bathyarchaeota archaeon]HEX69558.1 hypothetical protein [Candidatus Bathyarchaeota archaeon]